MCACDDPPDLEHVGKWPINWLWHSTSIGPIVTTRVVSRPGQTRTSRHYTTELLKDTDTVPRVLTGVEARGEPLPFIIGKQADSRTSPFQIGRPHLRIAPSRGTGPLLKDDVEHGTRRPEQSSRRQTLGCMVRAWNSTATNTPPRRSRHHCCHC